ncbi:hypothetical protein AMAG_04250 [Allomyces macrogynus ATCC 38327]|uniref:Uncharacterized protein n=1 Tax=Allomyces macrogynus (strain ATCC 38327) TaxID=578462 RepID=A0A0L0S876_ALLM3|nr:hypothetical protein AMAG_04250 [Allomyces macrogynus ATCC 38327]|eukprot:KNE58697.1 hypothetical protein AMAG_04250 [Allomyces macrogynus ATCC 38327]
MSCLKFAKKSNWKREEVLDHKWDFVDVEEYQMNDCWSYMGYTFLFLDVFRSFIVYLADVSTAMLIILFNQWSTKSPDEIVKNANLAKALGVSPSTYHNLADNLRWVYVGSIIVSFLLLANDMRKSRRIIQSHDISFAFTDVIAYRYYCLRSFAHWCFFQEIRMHHKTSDQIAQFVFFQLKGWKRLLFAEAPRHAVTALLLWYQITQMGKPTDDDLKKFRELNPTASVRQEVQFLAAFDIYRFISYFSGVQQLTKQFGVVTMAFVFTMFVINALSTLAAAVMYIPLLYRIRGNLKEYVCHMVDKRITALMATKRQMRVEEEQYALQQMYADGAAAGHHGSGGRGPQGGVATTFRQGAHHGHAGGNTASVSPADPGRPVAALPSIDFSSYVPPTPTGRHGSGAAVAPLLGAKPNPAWGSGTLTPQGDGKLPIPSASVASSRTSSNADTNTLQRQLGGHVSSSVISLAQQPTAYNVSQISLHRPIGLHPNASQLSLQQQLTSNLSQISLASASHAPIAPAAVPLAMGALGNLRFGVVNSSQPDLVQYQPSATAHLVTPVAVAANAAPVYAPGPRTAVPPNLIATPAGSEVAAVEVATPQVGPQQATATVPVLRVMQPPPHQTARAYQQPPMVHFTPPHGLAAAAAAASMLPSPARSRSPSPAHAHAPATTNAAMPLLGGGGGNARTDRTPAAAVPAAPHVSARAPLLAGAALPPPQATASAAAYYPLAPLSTTSSVATGGQRTVNRVRFTDAEPARHLYSTGDDDEP